MGKFLGKHAILDLEFGINSLCLSNHEDFMACMEKAILEENATIVSKDTHEFPGGNGYSFTFVLAESHASCHTWPEYGIATLDIYMCGECDAFRAMDNFVSELQKLSYEILKKHETKVFRGYVYEKET